jgi:ribosomal protein S18 acetylase RimI-like enzyme
VSGELRGFASYGPTSNAGELKLHKLYIHPECQREGFGTLLLRHVETTARQRGFTAVVLAVNKKNEKAIAAYLKNGFAVRESVIVDIGGGFVMDDYVMAKALM